MYVWAKQTRLLLSRSYTLVGETENQQIIKQEKYQRMKVSQSWTRCMQQGRGGNVGPACCNRWAEALLDLISEPAHASSSCERMILWHGLNLQSFQENCPWLVGDAYKAVNDWLIPWYQNLAPYFKPGHHLDLCARSLTTTTTHRSPQG